MANVGTAQPALGQNTQVVTVTQSVTGNIGDFVQFVTAFNGMVIHDVSLVYAGTASSTASVGDAGNAARFISASSTATSGTLRLDEITTTSSGVVTAGRGYTYGSAGVIGITLGGANVSAKAYTLSVTFSRYFGSSKSVIRTV